MFKDTSKILTIFWGTIFVLHLGSFNRKLVKLVRTVARKLVS